MWPDCERPQLHLGKRFLRGLCCVGIPANQSREATMANENMMGETSAAGNTKKNQRDGQEDLACLYYP